MELIMIDESRLKIMLTPTDMRHYDLHAEHMTTAGAATRRAFRHIFDDARERIGFDTVGERLFVQLYTSRTGGCEIFVTKLGTKETLFEESPEEVDMGELLALDDVPDVDGALSAHSASRERRSRADGTQALLKRLYKEDGMEQKDLHATIDLCEPPCVSAYRLETAEVLFALCRRLLTYGFSGQSRVYIDEREVWYLFLTPAVGEKAPPFLSEYAPRVEDPDTLALWLSERGRVICADRAVEILGRV